MLQSLGTSDKFALMQGALSGKLTEAMNPVKNENVQDPCLKLKSLTVHAAHPRKVVDFKNFRIYDVVGCMCAALCAHSRKRIFGLYLKSLTCFSTTRSECQVSKQ